MGMVRLLTTTDMQMQPGMAGTCDHEAGQLLTMKSENMSYPAIAMEAGIRDMLWRVVKS